jgi:hypothetical protein
MTCEFGFCTVCSSRADACSACTEKRIERLRALVKKLRCCENCRHADDPGYEGYRCELFTKEAKLKNRCHENYDFWEERD